MKLTVGQIKAIIGESLRIDEITDVNAASKRLMQLTQGAIDNPKNNMPALKGFMKTIEFNPEFQDMLLKVIKTGDKTEAASLAHDICSLLFGVSPNKML